MTFKLDNKQLDELRTCFNLFDEDQSGSICSSELKKVLDALGIQVNDNELVGLMNWMDSDGSGQIDFKEFANVMADLFYQKPNKRELNEAFKYFDLDKNGSISENELFIVMRRFNSDINRDDVKKVIRAVDKNNDGQINLDEFEEMMSG